MPEEVVFRNGVLQRLDGVGLVWLERIRCASADMCRKTVLLRVNLRL